MYIVHDFMVHAPVIYDRVYLKYRNDQASKIDKKAETEITRDLINGK